VAPAVACARGPVFHLCQGYEAAFSFYAKDRDRIRAAYALPTRKLVVAPHLAERLQQEGFRGAVVIGQAFDAAEFPPAEGRRFDADPPEVLLVGPYEADVKGVREALEAVRIARERGTRLRLRRISVTPPAAQERVLGLADRHDVSCPPREIARAYREADILLGPSHSDEGFGLPVLEALSSGLPSLLSDTPGHRHIAREAADHFREGDAVSAADALQSLIINRARRVQLSRLGPTEAMRFSTAKVADRLEEEFARARRG
jgi:glycosyltransferase involved in cell wall biosynthesis